MDSLIWYTGIFRIKSGILESSQESRDPAKIPKDSESRRRKFIVSDPSVSSYVASKMARASFMDIGTTLARQFSNTPVNASKWPDWSDIMDSGMNISASGQQGANHQDQLGDSQLCTKALNLPLSTIT